ncbi:MAG: 30S ribosomal protein S16 [Mycoplasmoidaceae bacterium]|nr:MAG: 30S ribosomal protein S16 [Mycoplasmoidaceae bacterium]
MLKIRMTRIGKHKSPAYRIVAVDSKSKRDGEYIELLGTYNAANNPKVSLKKDAIIKHLQNGAQPSDTVCNFLKKEGIWKEFTASALAAKKNKTPKEPKAKKVAHKKSK